MSFQFYRTRPEAPRSAVLFPQLDSGSIGSNSDPLNLETNTCNRSLSLPCSLPQHIHTQIHTQPWSDFYFLYQQGADSRYGLCSLGSGTLNLKPQFFSIPPSFCFDSSTILVSSLTGGEPSTRKSTPIHPPLLPLLSPYSSVSRCCSLPSHLSPYQI